MKNTSKAFINFSLKKSKNLICLKFTHPQAIQHVKQVGLFLQQNRFGES